VFAVEQQQVSEGDGGEGGLLQEEGQLLETLRGLCVHVQQSLVVQRHRVQLLPEPTRTECVRPSSVALIIFRLDCSYSSISTTHLINYLIRQLKK